MLPEPVPLISLTDIDNKFLYPRNLNYPLIESYDNGGEELFNPNEGLLSYVWKAWIEDDGVYCKRLDLEDKHLLVEDTGITEIDLTFDQNMNPCLAYYANGLAKLYWYDSQSAQQVITEFPDIRNPRVSLDDKRKFNVANSDIIFAYQKDDSLCYRLQRERYTIEHILATDNTKRILWRIGMGASNRFLFYWR